MPCVCPHGGMYIVPHIHVGIAEPYIHYEQESAGGSSWESVLGNRAEISTGTRPVVPHDARDTRTPGVTVVHGDTRTPYFPSDTVKLRTILPLQRPIPPPPETYVEIFSYCYTV